MSTRSFAIVARGPFALAQTAHFRFGERDDDQDYDGVLRLAFCADRTWEPVGVEVRPHPDGVRCTAHGAADLDIVWRQVARVLSLDHDGAAFVEVGRRDAVIARLQAVAPGLRPPLFPSPYEAALSCVLSARHSTRDSAELRRALSEQHGRTFDLAGRDVSAVPAPAEILALDAFPGIDAERLARLHGVAEAALTGLLDVDRVTSVDAATSMALLQAIKGIGPLYSEQVVVRASGLPDVLPGRDPKLVEVVARLYDVPATYDALEVVAEAWRPFRSWVAVLLRTLGPRLLTP